MATRKTVLLVDDLDGTSGADVGTTMFRLDGVDYRIDLSADNRAALRQSMSPYIAAARPVGRRPSPPTGGNAPGIDAAHARAWARARGDNVSERGRLPRKVVEAYLSAHGRVRD